MSMMMTEKRQMLSIMAVNLQMEPFRRESHGEWDVTDHLFCSAQQRVHSSPWRFLRRWIGRRQKHRWKHHWNVNGDVRVESITETSEFFSAAFVGFASQGCANFCANKRKKSKSHFRRCTMEAWLEIHESEMDWDLKAFKNDGNAWRSSLGWKQKFSWLEVHMNFKSTCGTLESIKHEKVRRNFLIKIIAGFTLLTLNLDKLAAMKVLFFKKTPTHALKIRLHFNPASNHSKMMQIACWTKF